MQGEGKMLAEKKRIGFVKKFKKKISLGWFHCLTSKSKERFPANNIIICLVMAKIQFSLIRKQGLYTQNTR